MHAVTPVPMARDNYGWLIAAPHGAIFVDPTDGPAAAAAVAQLGLPLQAIWATHHHHDHVGGILQLRAAQRAAVPVWGSSLDVAAGRIPGATCAVADGEVRQCAGLEVHAMHGPGHTNGAVSWYVPALAAVFVGDTLFASGCGRLFEGTPAQMWATLQRLRALPAQTAVCCGHEYTEKNLRFARTLEPEGSAQAAELAAAATEAHRHGAEGRPSVPTTLARERRLNPFLRADEPELQARLGHPGDSVRAFAELRQRRDAFAG